MTRILLILVGLLSLAVPIRGTERKSDARPASPAVTISTRTRVAAAPATFMATVRVMPHAENRVLRVAIEADDYYRSSDMQLAGLDAPRTRTIVWKDLPAGNYCVVAIVFRATGRPAVVRSRYVVTDSTRIHDDMRAGRFDTVF